MVKNTKFDPLLWRVETRIKLVEKQNKKVSRSLAKLSKSIDKWSEKYGV